MTRVGMRADAQRNYERMLSAAAETFAEEGPDASLNEIARRAKVGPGTLYRHFPNRQALLAAVLRERIEALGARAEELMSTTDPDNALREWLRAFLTHARADHGLGGAALTEPVDLGFDCHARIHEAAHAVVAHAQHAGSVRADVHARDVVQLIVGIALTTSRGSDSDRPEHLLGLVTDALYERRRDSTSS
ncbi:TetR/AcrR family transcriptional regulator [Nocardia speluncae]|uniref:TetR/AcrR family transcriptional regulator n=1 Tax=Nocardia speluncae TaxID=419477 RepID=A0A846XIE6_9NOCA|nr:TetR/AcrR family transcriptional regulator [Nocardia speluncae]NKY35125.1 TetR/AcrR family transcriptional regulator [Nocardia speluncae]